MGKVKETRYRLHPKPIGTESAPPMVLEPQLNRSLDSNQQVLSVPSNLFSKINIDIDKVISQLKRDGDTTSVSGRSHRSVKKDEQHLPKKEKMRLRHERFMTSE